MKELSSGASVFVKVDDYNDVTGIVAQLRVKVNEVRETLEKVEALRDKESEALQHWRSAIDEVEDKINSINSNLLEPEPR